VPEVVEVPPAPEPPVPEVPLAPLPPEPVVPPVPVFVPDLLLSPQPASTRAEMHTNAKSFFIAKLLEGKPIDHAAMVVCKKYSRAGVRRGHRARGCVRVRQFPRGAPGSQSFLQQTLMGEPFSR
jgi:hypothetical protein